jgi:hypothetical protein
VRLLLGFYYSDLSINNNVVFLDSWGELGFNFHGKHVYTVPLDNALTAIVSTHSGHYMKRKQENG